MDFSLFITFFHIIGVALGVGGATISDLVFFRSLKDKRLSRDELALLHTLGYVIWVGLAILFLSGLGFLLTQYLITGSVGYLSAAWFQAKMTIVFVLFCNALIFHTVIFPFLHEQVGTKLTHRHLKPKLPILATTGVISIVSWYGALTLGVTRGLDFSYGLIINLYLFLLTAGILVAYLLLSLVVFPRTIGKKATARDNSAYDANHLPTWLLVVLAIAVGVTLVLFAWFLTNSLPAKAIPENTDTYNSHDGHDHYRLSDEFAH